MTEDQFFSEKPQANILEQTVQRFMPFWPILVVFLGISLAVSHVYLRAQTKMYVAAAKVLIKDPQKASSESQVLEGLTKMSEKKSMENEIIVLRSSGIMQKVVKDLNIYTSIFNEGNVQTEELYQNNSPLVFEAINKDSINGGGKHYFDIDWKNNSISINSQKVSLSNGVVNIGGTFYRIKVNETYNKAAKGKKYFAVFQSAEGAAGGFAGAVRAVQGSYGSNVLDLSMQTPVPQRGVDILNKLFEIYNTDGVIEKNQMYTKSLLFIDGRLGVVEGQLDSVEKSIMAYKAQEMVTNLTGQASVYFNTVSELDKRNISLDLQLEVLRDLQGYINNKGRDPGTVPSLALVSDPFLSTLLSQLYSAEFELETVRSTSGEKSEAVLLANEKVRRSKEDLRENLNNIRANYLTEKASNNAEINKNNSQLMQVPSKERGLLDISRQQSIKNEIYTFLLKKREETALASRPHLQ